jgi:hypothetical protein
MTVYPADALVVNFIQHAINQSFRSTSAFQNTDCNFAAAGTH